MMVFHHVTVNLMRNCGLRVATVHEMVDDYPLESMPIHRYIEEHRFKVWEGVDINLHGK